MWMNFQRQEVKKIMRRVLRKLALGDSDEGDLSTLADSKCNAKIGEG